MADANIAWSNFVDKDGKKIKPGDTVDAGQLGVDEEEWNELVFVGAVRSTKYPEDINTDESPVEYYKRQMAEMAEGDFGKDFGEAAGFSPVTGPMPDEERAMLEAGKKDAGTDKEATAEKPAADTKSSGSAS